MSNVKINNSIIKGDACSTYNNYCVMTCTWSFKWDKYSLNVFIQTPQYQEDPAGRWQKRYLSWRIAFYLLQLFGSVSGRCTSVKDTVPGFVSCVFTWPCPRPPLALADFQDRAPWLQRYPSHCVLQACPWPCSIRYPPDSNTRYWPGNHSGWSHLHRNTHKTWHVYHQLR